MPRLAPVLVLLSIGAVGCSDGLKVSVANGGPVSGGMGGFIYLRNGHGDPLPANDGDTVVDVDTRSPDTDWAPAASVTIEHVTPPLVDVVIVADNSGSEANYLQAIQDAVIHFGHTILVREPDDEMGLVRVSTVSTVLQPLTTDEAAFDSAAGTLFVNRGWTALWDGVRMGNETLADGAQTVSDTGVCVDHAFRSIVVFTDGKENNSADEHQTKYTGDGIDTTFDDLLALQVHGAQTAIDTVAVGNNVDVHSLAKLADGTGGLAKKIDNFQGLEGALLGAAAQLDNYTPFCFQPASCADTEARVTVQQQVRPNQWETRDFTMSIPPTCSNP